MSTLTRPGPVAARSAGVWRALRGVLPPFLVFVLIIAVWYVVTLVVLAPDRRFILPVPHEVLVRGFLDADARGDILAALLETAKVAGIGLAISTALGVGTAILMSQAKWVERSLYPWAVFLQTVPILAIVPVIGFWFGFALPSRVIVCVIVSLFPLIINTLQGLLGVDRSLHDLMSMGAANRWERLVQLQLPSALPSIFTGLQTAAGLSVVGAVVGDFFFGRGDIGVGLLLSRYSSRLESAEMLATVFAACLLGVVVFWLFGVLGRRAVGHWSEAWAPPRRP